MLKKVLMLVSAALVSAGAYAANFAIYRLGSTTVPPAVTCDITTGIATGVGAGTCIASPATCNGVVDDAAAFAAFNAWATGTWQPSHTGLIALSIPAGKHCRIIGNTVTCATFNANQKCPFVNILKMLLIGAGSGSSTLTTASISLSGMGIPTDNSHSARANTVTAGSSCITLVSTPTATVSGMADNGSGKWRVTLNDTTGFVNNTAYYFSGILGATKANGLQPVQVIDGTHVDLLTVGVDQTYTGGGTVGGDRTGLFTVGDYAVMGGFDIQGLWLAPSGAPPNLHYFEHVKVASKNSGTGQVCFDAPLANTYKSTWPMYNSGNVFQADAGGPATLYFMPSSWNSELEVRGLTVNDNGNQVYARGRSVTYRDIVFTGSACAVPTENATWAVYDVFMAACNIEIDKLVGAVTIVRTEGHFFKFQSSSVNSLTMQNSTADAVTGTPKIANISGSTLTSFAPGAYAYGRSDETVCTNCVLPTITGTAYTEKGPADIGMNIAASMSGGVITVPNTLNAVRWAVPGTNLFWQGAQRSETSFRVVDVTQDLTNTYVTTTLAGGFPAVPLTGGKLFIAVHPAPKFTCTNCTGSADAVDLAQAPAAAPLYSYSQRTYTQATLTSSAAAYSMWGAITSYGVNVTSAYAGAQTPLALHPASQFSYPTIKADYSTGSYAPSVDLRAAGNRVITGATCPGAGCTGNQANDTGLGFPEASTWFTGPLTPFISSNVSASGTFSVTITVQTDQGVVNP